MDNYHMTICVIMFVLLLNIFFINSTSKSESFIGYYLAQPTKCFSCEAELPEELKYLGGPTKCFSCERELIQKYGKHFADLGQPSKCYSCENQYGPNLN